MLRGDQTLFSVLAVGDVTSDKEILLLGFRPLALPPKGDEPALSVHVAAFKAPRRPGSACHPHLITGILKVLAVHYFHAAATDHLVRITIQKNLRTRADPDQRAPAIGDDDQIKRSLEDAPD